MRISILDIDYYLPEIEETNEELTRQFPGWNIQGIEEKTGVKKRHIAASNETALDLAVKACERLFHRNPSIKSSIDGLIFCTQSPDHLIPSNSCLLQHVLGLPENVMAFDINHACSGYTYGLGIARGLIQSGACSSLLLVNADTYSKYINKGDRSTRVLFGDGAAASWVSQSVSGQPRWDLLDINFGTYGFGADKFMIPVGGHRHPKSTETVRIQHDRNGNERCSEDIHMDGFGVLTFVKTKVVEQILQLCQRNNLQIADVDLFVFHQASRLALDALQRILKIPESKNFINLDLCGNTVSASIPIALRQAQAKGLFGTDNKLIISGFGAGLSASSAYLRFSTSEASSLRESL